LVLATVRDELHYIVAYLTLSDRLCGTYLVTVDDFGRVDLTLRITGLAHTIHILYDDVSVRRIRGRVSFEDEDKDSGKDNGSYRTGDADNDGQMNPHAKLSSTAANETLLPPLPPLRTPYTEVPPVAASPAEKLRQAIVNAHRAVFKHHKAISQHRQAVRKADGAVEGGQNTVDETHLFLKSVHGAFLAIKAGNEMDRAFKEFSQPASEAREAAENAKQPEESARQPIKVTDEFDSTDEEIMELAWRLVSTLEERGTAFIRQA
jgi:hypothetical protein